jgi:arginyl-tRNA synthetase
MALAKERKLNPRQLATEIKNRMVLPEWASMEIAGAGFLNFRLDANILATTLESAVRGEHLFFEHAAKPRTIVIDFSSPNVAKPMHVGHIRSTILGDCLTRTFRLLGHRVITDNHIGDWGTQFGKLLAGWKNDLDRNALLADPIAEMERLYKKINTACEADPAVLDRARQELVRLQSGDAENLAIWREMIALSQRQFDHIYARLGVRFDFALGESFYNPQLKSVVQELRESGLARESEGAVAVFFDDIAELKTNPALVQKSDGGFNYLATDLATFRYRMETWHPDEIVYVTDGRQQLHFKQLFAVARAWQPNLQTKLTHVWFGAILGEDGKPFKTRAGEIVKLSNLLDEAEERARAVVKEKNPDLSENERSEIGRIVGIGAIKYADLLPNRQSDYVFSWDKMLAFNGNAVPYLQFAYTRTQSIFRKLEESDPGAKISDEISRSTLKLTAGEEVVLAKHLLNFGIVLEAVADEYRPNFLCNYLYDLAGYYARFWEACPVLKATGTERMTRLALCELTGRVLKQGLELLGIEAPEKM